MLQAMETRDIFSGVESVAPPSQVEDHRLLEGWSSCLLQVLPARRALILKNQCWGLVGGSVSGLMWAGWLVPHHLPKRCRARVRMILRACQPAGPGRVGCFRSGCRLFDKAETMQWLVVSRVSLKEIEIHTTCMPLLWLDVVSPSESKLLL